QRYSAVGPEFRSVTLPQLRQAQRGYAESTLALLDFLDTRDRRLLATYQEQTSRINKALEDRARTRDELQRLLRGDGRPSESRAAARRRYELDGRRVFHTRLHRVAPSAHCSPRAVGVWTCKPSAERPRC